MIPVPGMPLDPDHVPYGVRASDGRPVPPALLALTAGTNAKACGYQTSAAFAGATDPATVLSTEPARPSLDPGATHVNPSQTIS